MSVCDACTVVLVLSRLPCAPAFRHPRTLQARGCPMTLTSNSNSIRPLFSRACLTKMSHKDTFMLHCACICAFFASHYILYLCLFVSHYMLHCACIGVFLCIITFKRSQSPQGSTTSHMSLTRDRPKHRKRALLLHKHT